MCKFCDTCKFCNAEPHTANCPRTTPGADERYSAGRFDGSRYLEPTTVDAAYMAGWRKGDREADAIAEEAAAANSIDY